MKASRRILLLQGPPTPFWHELGLAFRREGADVRRVLLCPGDRLAWKGAAVSYRGRLRGWGDWLTRLVSREAITDIVVYGDQQPYHRDAGRLARRLGLGFFVIEFGYLRPGWLTLERGGMGARSHVPNDPATIRRLAGNLPETLPAPTFAHRTATEALSETLFVVANEVLRPFYPFYSTQSSVNPIIDYASTILRWRRQWSRHADDARVLARAAGGGWPFVLLPLQLQTDSQIRWNSPWRDLRDMLDAVFASFARHAPPDLNLLLKVHPLDVGLVDWARTAASLALGHGLSERVATVDGGDLAALLRACRGVVLVNSTVGLHAIRAGRPVKALGAAVYDIPGLTHQGPLESFWTRPEPVDAALASDFVRVLAHTVQVAGSFYVPEGRRLAIDTMVSRILENRVNEPGAFVDPPPRLATALASGVPD
ncbi:MAG: capsular biosynthesis protein [Alsobacter sp.]